jgi:methionyl-tRNA formyltransferase
MKVGLIGGVSSTIATLKKLLSFDFNIACVFGYKPSKNMLVSGYVDMEEFCTLHSISFYPFTSINNEAEKIQNMDIDVLFVVGLSQIVSAEIIHSASVLTIGFHPTLLPKGRGRAPIAWLVNDLSDGAATFFQLTDKPDQGNILVQEKFKLNESDDAGSVEMKIISAINNALDIFLPNLKKNTWSATPQDEILVTEYGVRKPEDGMIDWNNSAESIDRLIKAATTPHPGAFSYLKNSKIIIYRSKVESDGNIKGVVGRVLKVKERDVLVQTGYGLIWINSYLADDNSTLRTGDFLGYKVDIEINQLKSEINQLKSEINQLKILLE